MVIAGAGLPAVAALSPKYNVTLVALSVPF